MATLVSRVPGEDDADRPAPTVAEILRSDAFRRPQRVYPTPWPALDRLLGGGIRSRQLNVIAAPSGVGKTSMAVQLAIHYGRMGLPALIASTEIESSEVAARVAAQVMGTTAARILELDVDPAIAAAATDLPIYVRELNVFELETSPVLVLAAEIDRVSAARRGQRPVVIVDYIQHLAVEDGDRRRSSVSAIANGLRRVAQAADVAMVVVSSVSRAFYGKKNVEDRDDPRSWLAAAKESGDIEYATSVLAVLEVGAASEDDDWAPARLIVAKSRRGRAGFVSLRFHGPTGVFSVGDDVPGAKDARDDRDAEIVFNKVDSWPGGPPSPRSIRMALAMSGGRMKELVDILVADGRLRRVRAKNGEVLVIDRQAEIAPNGEEDRP